MISTSKNITSLMASLHTVQAILNGVEKNAENPFHKSRYASLEAVLNTARGPMNDNGLVFTQAPGAIKDNAIEIVTQISHAASGEWLRSAVQVALAKQDPQAVGAAITYGCRYSLMAILGMPPLDDDVETGMNNQKSAHKARKDGDYETLKGEMEQCDTADQLREWGMDNRNRISALPSNWVTHLQEEYERIMTDLRIKEKDVVA